MEIKTVYNHFTKQDMYIGANGRLFETRIEAVDHINAVNDQYKSDMDYIANEFYGKNYLDLTASQYEEVYHEYNRAKLY